MSMILERNKVKNPGEGQSDNHELGKHLNPVEEAFPQIVFSHNPEHGGYEKSEQCHYQKMPHDFLSAEISNASSITR